MTSTFGMEEEFAVLDPVTLETVDVGERAVRELASNAGGGTVVHEFFASQFEYVSPIFASGVDAAAAIHTFRSAVADWAAEAGLVVAGTATPLRTTTGAGIWRDERYGRIDAVTRALTPDHQINALHVHLGIDHREDGVRISNRLRPWLPVLVALSANSPFWHGEDTGFASWRTVHSRRWTTHGIPPVFTDAHDYDAAVAAHLGVGVTSDEGTINWNVRLSHHHPTVEVRVFDAQLDPVSSLGLTMLVRALAFGDADPLLEPASGLWDAAQWHAARFGLSSTLVDPFSGRLRPAAEVVGLLRSAAAPGLEHHGDTRIADEFLRRIAADGVGADRQRSAGARGTAALAELYRTQLDAPLAVPASGTTGRRAGWMG